MPDFVSFLPLLIGAGLLGGFLSGLLGVGGGIVMTPLLFYVFGATGADRAVQMHLALATSLAIILPTGLSSVRAHRRRGGVLVALVRGWAPWLAIGAASGAIAASLLGSNSLVLVFGTLAVLMGIKMILPLEGRRLGTAVPQGPAGAGAPLLIGFLASLMGIGGATFSVPYLTVFGTPVHKAVGTAAAFGLVVAGVAATGYLIGGLTRDAAVPWGTLGFISVPAVALIAPASVIAAPFGARVAHGLSQRRLSLIFGLFLLAAGGRLLASVL